VVFLGLFLLGCFAGGWLITAGAFRLRLSEDPIVGFAAGIVVSTWLANLLGHFLPVAAAFWLACALTVLIGLGLALTARPSLPRLRQIPWAQLASLLVIAYVYFLIGRGLGIFDDYQNLPELSLLASGDIPPHFALNPSISFGYHYFLLMFAAQMMRLANLFPWNALDLARAFVFALTVLLAWNWGVRFTGNRLAGLLTASFVALSGGMRWLLLFIPQHFAPSFAANIHLIGTGLATAPDLITALGSPWVLAGAGPLPFPFAFANGVFRPLVMALDGVGSMGEMVLLMLLLTHSRWRRWRGAVLTTIFLAALALLLETEFLLLYAAFVLVVVVTWIRARRVYLRGSLGTWLGVGFVAALIAALQGGVLTGIAQGFARRLLPGAALPTSYFSFNFALSWPPAMVSAHLGTLSVANPYQLVALLAEAGLVILVFPLVMLWGWKSLRIGRWFEAAFAFMAALSLCALFFRYSGIAGESATLRLYGPFFKVCTFFAVPLTWVWARHRGNAVKVTGLTLAGLTMLGGVVMLSLQLVAITRPVFSYYLFGLDAKVFSNYYDRLDPGALVFDPLPTRAPAILGRPTDSSLSWYQTKPEWNQLRSDPDPFALRAAGFHYALLDERFWDGLSKAERDRLRDSCVKTVFRYEGLRNPPQDERKDFRWLLDLRACR
jgi:hypothetical protein